MIDLVKTRFKEKSGILIKSIVALILYCLILLANT
tara:strand:+ start:2254 stop:2358 length:105 start_codon:yes stop_codon:yes gene_type:complete